MNTKPPSKASKYHELLQKLLAEGMLMGLGEVFVHPVGDGKNYFVSHDIQTGLALKNSGKLTPDLADPAFQKQVIRDLPAAFIPADPSAPDSGVMKQNPDAYRIVLPVNEDTTIPVSWDANFKVSAGDLLVVLQKDVEQLGKALTAIRTHKMTVEEALYNDGRTAKFDIFGTDWRLMRDKGYAPVAPSEKTRSITAQFSAILHPKPYIPQDYAAPERATFAKRKPFTLAV